jgi:dolichol-phosphate mannosyltransferase
LSSRTVFIIGPAYNEESVIGLYLDAVFAQKRELVPFGRIRIVLVDDGSRDRTSAAIRERQSQLPDGIAVSLLKLSRNFGHQSAIQAGLQHAYDHSRPGDLFLLMDTDLQHPPEWIPKILARLDQGVHHVQMLREEHESIGLGKKLTSRIFYRVFTWLSDMELDPGSSDFRGMSRDCLRAYLSLQEKGRFNRGLFRWIGFSTEKISYQAAARAAGHSKYSTRRMARLAFIGLTYFSSRPLIYGLLTIVGCAFLFCAAYVGLELWRLSQGVEFALGWPSLVFFVTFWGGLLALGQLLLALYVSRIFDEVKGRPIYLIEEIHESHPH